MAWISLGDALEMALEAGMIDGVESGGTLSDAYEDAIKWEYAALTTRDAPSPAAYCHLVVDNGGGVRAGGGFRPGAYARLPGGNSRSNLVVVSG